PGASAGQGSVGRIESGGGSSGPCGANDRDRRSTQLPAVSSQRSYGTPNSISRSEPSKRAYLILSQGANMSTKAASVAAIRSVPRSETEDRLDLMSPQFTTAGWCICAEHQRDFRSVVLKWIGPTGNEAHLPPAGAVVCPLSDREKGWEFRVDLLPDQL